MTWKINVFAHTVIIQDTQWYNGRAHTYADYAVTDVLRMMGRAGRITLDEEGKCIVLCQSSKKEFFKKVQPKYCTFEIKWGACSRWPSCLGFPVRNSDTMTMGKAHSTLV